MPGAGWSGVIYSPAVVTASDGDPAGGVSVSRGGAGHTAPPGRRRKEGWLHELIMQCNWHNDPKYKDQQKNPRYKYYTVYYGILYE